MSSSATLPAPAAKRRWRPRFGLRALLVLLTVLAIGLAYLGNVWHRAEHQRSIVAKIEGAGGDVRYNWQFGMGEELDFHESDHGYQPESIHHSETPDGRNKRTRITSAGETVEIETPPGPKLVRRLLGDDTFARVEAVSFGTDEAAPRFDPQLLLELPQLKFVAAAGPQVNNEWIGILAKVPELRAVSLQGDSGSTATAEGLARLQACEHLFSLSLDGEWVQDETLGGIADLRQLKTLGLIQVPNITSRIFFHLKELTELRELCLFRAKGIDDRGTEHLRQLRKLKTLMLLDTSISDATLAHCTGMTDLEFVDLSLSNVGDAGVEHLAALPKLKYLRIGGKSNLSDEGLRTIGRMRQLESLMFSATSVTDGGMLHLRQLPNLKRLSAGPHVTKEGANVIRKALPDCEVVVFDETGISIDLDH